MTGRTSVLVLFLVAALLAAGAEATARALKGREALAILPSLKIGQWIQIEGTPLQPQGALCTELELMAGDFLDDDWILGGKVSSVDVRAHQFVIGGIRVQIAEHATFESDGGSFHRFADLRPAMVIEIEGTYRRNRTFLAEEIDDESDEIARRPTLAGRTWMVGRIERVDVVKHRVTVMGTDFQVNEKSRLKSLVH